MTEYAEIMAGTRYFDDTLINIHNVEFNLRSPSDCFQETAVKRCFVIIAYTGTRVVADSERASFVVSSIHSYGPACCLRATLASAAQRRALRINFHTRAAQAHTHDKFSHVATIANYATTMVRDSGASLLITKVALLCRFASALPVTPRCATGSNAVYYSKLEAMNGAGLHVPKGSSPVLLNKVVALPGAD
eukprot:6206176-Pleurochrysis_carterae.AAC.2